MDRPQLNETKRDQAVASIQVIIFKAQMAFEIAHFKKAKFLIIDESTHQRIKTEMAQNILGVAEGHRMTDVKTFAGMTVVLVKAAPLTIEFGF